MAYNLIEMTNHSHLEFAFLTNFYHGSMTIQKGIISPRLAILNTIKLYAMFSISHFLIFFNQFYMLKQKLDL